eukprot:2369833-Prymnesium_polylepis.1
MGRPDLRPERLHHRVAHREDGHHRMQPAQLPPTRSARGGDGETLNPTGCGCKVATVRDQPRWEDDWRGQSARAGCSDASECRRYAGRQPAA